MGGTRAPEIRALTGVRAIAAWWVVLYHMQPVVDLLPWGAGDALRFLAGAGYMGVDLFFVLSGFILSYNYAETFESPRLGAYLRFLWMRLARIYPVHLVTLLGFGVLFLLARAQGLDLPRSGQFNSEDLVRNLLLVQAWEIPIRSSWNGPAWSISAEWLAYLLFPVAIVSTGVPKTTRSLLGAAASLLLGMIAVCSLIELPTTLGLGLVRIAAEFGTGCLLFRVYDRERTPDPAWDWISGGLLVAAVATGSASEALDLRAFWTAPLFAASIYALARASAGVAFALSSRPLVFWGRVSYSLYMTHYFFVLAMIRFLPDHALAGGSPVTRIAVVGAWFWVVAATAMATFRVVEQPARRWMGSLPAATGERGPDRGRRGVKDLPGLS